MSKQEFAPLLSLGLHPMTLQEMRASLVDAFRGSKRRPLIMAGFEKVVQRFLEEKIEGQFWIDGSFLTKKLDPGNADILFLVKDQYFRTASTQQQVVIDWIARRDLRTEFYCHSFLHYIQEPGHPE